MVLLDAGKFTAYCRWCWWSSPSSGSLRDAHRALASHRCPDRSPRIGWCAVCGRLRFGGLRPAGPSRARTAVKTWRCHDWATCRRRAR
jgi:hypothetical protein